jgi:hypothetical protein
VIYSAEVGVLLLCFYGGKYLREVAVLGLGTILGGALLYALLQYNGVLQDFVTFVLHQRTIRAGGVPKDPSLPLIIVAGFCLAFDQFRRGEFRWRSPLLFGLTAGVLVPAGQLSYGWFSTNYTWMAILPVSVGIFTEFSRAGSAIGLLAKSGAAVALCASALIGMPMQLASAIWFWQERDYSRVIDLVQAHVSKEDWVYCDPSAYYPAKAMAGAVFVQGYDKFDRFFTPEEKSRISIMIIAPYWLERSKEKLGGSWSATGEPIRPPTRGLLFFKPNFGDKLVANYDLQVYRRNRDGGGELSDARLGRRSWVTSRASQSLDRPVAHFDGDVPPFQKADATRSVRTGGDDGL